MFLLSIIVDRLLSAISRDLISDAANPADREAMKIVTIRYFAGPDLRPEDIRTFLDMAEVTIRYFAGPDLRPADFASVMNIDVLLSAISRDLISDGHREVTIAREAHRYYPLFRGT